MRQKVGIAIALAKDAKALLLDEPTSGLDPSASYEFSVLLRRFAERGAAVLMATHDLARRHRVAPIGCVATFFTLHFSWAVLRSMRCNSPAVFFD
jgi:ABC-2 type transport system ATP-binding protein